MKGNLYEKYRPRLEKLCLMDDDFMTAVFEDSPGCVELVLRIILGKNLTVLEAKTQHSLKTVRGRSVRLDIFAKDDKNILYNIEVQRDDRGASPQWAGAGEMVRSSENWFSAPCSFALQNCGYIFTDKSLLDANLLGRGDGVDGLPRTYVIFITESDVLHGGKPLYTVERVVRETRRAFGDGSTIVYVNASHRDDSALGRLMHDFSCAEPERMYYAELRERTNYFKSDEQGARKMSKIFDEILDEVREDGIQEGKQETSVAVAKESFSIGLTIEQIAVITKLSLEQLRQIQAAM